MKTIYKNLILISLLFISYGLFAQFAGGSGTVSDPYQVSTPEQLSEIRNYLDKHFIQMNNIDLEKFDYNDDGKGWMPIAGGGTTDRFTGSFNGQDFEIRNLVISRPGIANVGLFGHIGASDNTTIISIKNVSLINVDIIGGRGVGALAGRVTSNGLTKIEFSFAKGGIVKGDGALGGLVGSNNSYLNNPGLTDKPRISRSYTDLRVEWSQIRSGDKFGGLAGCTQRGIIENSFSRSDVIVDNTIAGISSLERVGGLVGCATNRGEIINSYSTGEVVAAGSPTITNVGGLLGSREGNTNIENSYWDTETSGMSTSNGGNGLTSAQMNLQSNYIGFNFIEIWGIDPNINDGYPYLLSENNFILPVNLVYFKAKIVDNHVVLDWKTASEKNNDYFSVERSTNGFNFIEIERVNGSGFSSVNISYNAIDKDIVKGTSYYRLKQTDFDGSFEYSEIISITYFPDNIKFEVYPNPSNGFFMINSDFDANTNYRIMDNSGRIIAEATIDAYNNEVNIQNFPSGVYFILLSSDNKESKAQRIIISK